MKCTKHFINAVNTTTQATTAGGAVTFSQIVAEGYCVGFTAGSTTFTLPCKGIYAIYFDADIIPAATGAVVVSITNNGTVIPAAIASNQMTEAEATHVAVQGVINVMKSCECINNTAQVQVVVSAITALNNANIIIEKIA